MMTPAMVMVFAVGALAGAFLNGRKCRRGCCADGPKLRRDGDTRPWRPGV